MSAKIKYSDEQIQAGKPVTDFLPSPEELVLKEDTVKVTLSLTKDSVDFFKVYAKKHGTPYQQMIRRLLDAYAQAHRK